MRLLRVAICLAAYATSASGQTHTLVALSHSDHTVNEVADLATLDSQAMRAAVTMHRLRRALAEAGR